MANRGLFSSTSIIGAVPAAVLACRARAGRALSTAAAASACRARGGRAFSTLPAPEAAPEGAPLLSQPRRVTFDTNPDDCNFSCTMCEQHSVHSGAQAARAAAGVRRRRMAPAVFLTVLEQLGAAGGLQEVIPSTMGEPLMYAHFDALVAAVRSAERARVEALSPDALRAELAQRGAPHVDTSSSADLVATRLAAAGPGLRLNLTTNGSFYPGKLGRSVAQWAAELLPMLSDVKISWNGATKATQESIMVGSSFERQLANLRAWLAARDALAAAGGNRASVTLQLTFMRTNLAEIPDVVALAAGLGVDRVKGHHLWAHFAPIKGDDLRRSEASVAAWNAAAARCREIAASTPLPSGGRLRLEHFEDLAWTPPAAVAPSAAAAQRDDGATLASAAAAQPSAPALVDPESECPFLGREAWVNHAGDFAPCCAPDAQRKSLGSFGNVGDKGGILGIWRGPAYRSLVQNYKSHPLCQTCHMRKPKAAAPAVVGAPSRAFATEARRPAARTAIVPIAGLATRMAPLSAVTSKAFLPLLTASHASGARSGGSSSSVLVARPALDLLLTDVLAPNTGIERAILVVAPAQVAAVCAFLESWRPDSGRGGGPLSSYARRVNLVVQHQPRGLGDAVLCARAALGGEPHVMVVLGDHLFSCRDGHSAGASAVAGSGARCVELLQMQAATLAPELGLTAVGTCSLLETSAAGLVSPAGPLHAAALSPPHSSLRVFPVAAILEKPAAGTPANSLARYEVPGSGGVGVGDSERSFLCFFGLDILPQRIFAHLEAAARTLPANRELCLRAAMARLADEGRLCGGLMPASCERHDVGNPQAYLASLRAFAGPGTADENSREAELKTLRAQLAERDSALAAALADRDALLSAGGARAAREGGQQRASQL